MKILLTVSILANILLAAGWLWSARETDQVKVEPAGTLSLSPKEHTGRAADIPQTTVAADALSAVHVDSRAASPPHGAGVSDDTPVEDDESSDDDDASKTSRWTIPLPDTHKGFFESPKGLPDFHAELEAEEPDPSWGEVVEGLLSQHIAGHPLAESVSVLNIECRETLCEVIGTVFGENGGDRWNTIMADMRQAPWFATYLEDGQMSAGASFPGEHRFAVIMARVGHDSTPPVPPP